MAIAAITRPRSACARGLWVGGLWVGRLWGGAALLLVALGLAGCDIAVTAPREVRVIGEQITVRAPRFYCVDTGSTRATTDTAVVLIGPCTAAGHVAAAVLTVSVGRAASGGVFTAGSEKLRQFLSSNAGRRALSRSGRAGDVAVLGSGVVDGVLLMHINDRAVGAYWRAILGVRGRLVTISATGAEGAPLSSAEGRDLVEQTAAALLKANPA